MKNIKVLKVEPNKAPELVTISDDLSTLQDAVGGNIECIYPFEDEVAIVCNEEGKLDGMEPNRVLRGANGSVYDVLCGTFLITGLTKYGFKSLTKKLADKYTALYSDPNSYWTIDRAIPLWGGELI